VYWALAVPARKRRKRPRSIWGIARGDNILTVCGGNNSVTITKFRAAISTSKEKRMVVDDWNGER